MDLLRLTTDDKEQIKSLYKSVFMNEPWNDDWSDDKQLDEYILDLIGNRNSLSLGLVEDGQFVGMALGSVKHWYSGTEYYIEELFIKTELQGNGIGSEFIELIEQYLRDIGIHRIFLQTDNDMPAYSFYKKRGFRELNGHVSFIKENL